MTIVNTVQRLMNGYGNGSGPGSASNPTGYASASAVALSTTTNTAVTMGTQGYTNGLIRVKVYGGGGSNTTVTVAVSVSDGTSTIVVFPVTNAMAVPSTVATSGCDLLIDVNTDIQIATVTITTVVGGTTTTASMDYEICLNP